MPRGFGAMAAMFLVAPLINRVDNRLIILSGFLVTAVAMWQMSQFSLQMVVARCEPQGTMSATESATAYKGWAERPRSSIAIHLHLRDRRGLSCG
jgi:DHA2 family multidrug resistance protein